MQNYSHEYILNIILSIVHLIPLHIEQNGAQDTK